MSCQTEHDKNEVYQIVNIALPIKYLDSGIPYFVFAHHEDHLN